MAPGSGPARPARNVSPTRLALPLVLMAIGTVAPPGHAADDYLDAIQSEAGKVGAEPAATDNPAASAARKPAPSGPVEAFERQLEERFAGTYLFYKRLPPESKEEIYRQFKDGAPIEDVRRTIMSRFLHTR